MLVILIVWYYSLSASSINSIDVWSMPVQKKNFMAFQFLTMANKYSFKPSFKLHELILSNGLLIWDVYQECDHLSLIIFTLYNLAALLWLMPSEMFFKLIKLIQFIRTFLIYKSCYKLCYKLSKARVQKKYNLHITNSIFNIYASIIT